MDTSINKKSSLIMKLLSLVLPLLFTFILFICFYILYIKLLTIYMPIAWFSTKIGTFELYLYLCEFICVYMFVANIRCCQVATLITPMPAAASCGED